VDNRDKEGESMSDIVERLRLLVPSDSSGAAHKAADEITRLTAEVEMLREMQRTLLVEQGEMVATLTARVRELEGMVQKAYNDGFNEGIKEHTTPSRRKALVNEQMARRPHTARAVQKEPGAFDYWPAAEEGNWGND
jgi:hypothetical protein